MEKSIERLHREGRSLRYIASKTGIPHTRVRRIIQGMGYSTAIYVWPEHSYRVAKRKRNLGYSYADIAKYLNENNYADSMGRTGKFTRSNVRKLIMRGDPNE